MIVICEMFISDFFKLSSGHVALVGRMLPDIENFIPNNSKADLYVSGEKVRSINIVGEDRFSGVDESKRQGKRSVRTDCDISENLKAMDNVKLIIYR